MASTLRDLRVKFVSLVDRGANYDPKTGDGAHILIHKRDAPDGWPAWLKTEAAALAAKEHTVKHENEKPGLLKSVAALLTKAASMLSGAPEETAEGEGDDAMAGMKAHHEALGKAIDAYGDCSKLAADHPVHGLKALHAEMGKSLADHATKTATAKAEKADNQTKADKVASDAADLEKRATLTKREQELTDRLEVVEKRATDAEAIAKSERDARALDGMKTDLRKFQHVPVDVEKEAAGLLELKQAHPKAYETLMAKMAGVEEVAKAAKGLERDLGSPLGGDGTGGSAWTQIESEAAAMVQKDGKLTKAKAIDLVMKKRPDLVRKHNAESRPQ